MISPSDFWESNLSFKPSQSFYLVMNKGSFYFNELWSDIAYSAVPIN